MFQDLDEQLPPPDLILDVAGAGSGNEGNGNGSASGNGADNAVSGTIGGLTGDPMRSSNDTLAEVGDTTVDLADTAAGMAKDAEGTVVEIVKLVGDDAAKLARLN